MCRQDKQRRLKEEITGGHDRLELITDVPSRDYGGVSQHSGVQSLRTDKPRRQATTQHRPDDGSELQDVQQQNERPVPAEVPVDEGEGQLHEHGRHEREEERETLPDSVSS